MKIIFYILITFCLIVVFAIFVFLSYEKGRIKGGKAAEINDFNYYYTIVKNFPKDKINTPLYHYLKGQYYYYSIIVRDKTIEKQLEDFGKINDEILPLSYYGHESCPADEIYNGFLKKYERISNNVKE